MSAGANHITRNSKESSVTVHDRLRYLELVKKTDAAIEEGTELHLEEYLRPCGIPERMLLPKGKSEGMEFTLAVAITDGEKDLIDMSLVDSEKLASSYAHCGVHGEKYPDKKPLGFPLDRKIPDERIFLETPNVYKGVVKIYHRK